MTRPQSLHRLFLPAVLLALGAHLPAQQAEAKREFAAIQKEYDAEFAELRKAAAGLPQAESGALYTEFFATVLPEFLERTAVLARAERGSPLAHDAWSRIISQATSMAPMAEVSKKLVSEALDALLADHLASKTLGNVVASLRYSASVLGDETVLRFADELGRRTPLPEVRAEARFAHAAVLAAGSVAGDPRRKQALAELAALESEFGELASSNGRSHGENARGLRFELENLSIGQACPDFSAVDAEGVAFKLSDYKGKVVLIDFWGFW
jgi:hypothetical protein